MSIAKYFFIIISAFALVVFVMNKSISSYLEQRYHFHFFPQNDVLNEANSFKVKLEQIKVVLTNDHFIANYEILKSMPDNNRTMKPRTPPQQQIFYGDEEEQEHNATQVQIIQKPKVERIQKLDIKEDEEFLLIGDSLMQGVALALIKDLKKLGIKSTNLSKQNTGLSYKSYFDWAKATQVAFMSNANIKYIVVLLGANDPWDIKSEGKFHGFNTNEWTRIYTQRVDELIQIAKEYDVKVLWYEVPPVKRDILNTKIQVLNKIYKQENLRNNEIFINTSKALSEDEKYSSYIRDENNKSVKVRADDGIHFNIKGAKIMSDLLLQHLNVVSYSQ